MEIRTVIGTSARSTARSSPRPGPRSAPDIRLPSKGIAFESIMFAEPRVLHDFRVDAVAIRARLVQDVGDTTVSPALSLTL